MALPTKGLAPAFLYALGGTYAGSLAVMAHNDTLPACETRIESAKSVTPLTAAPAGAEGCSDY